MLKCPDCDRSFRLPMHLARHRTSKHGSKTHKEAHVKRVNALATAIQFSPDETVARIECDVNALKEHIKALTFELKVTREARDDLERRLQIILGALDSADKLKRMERM